MHKVTRPSENGQNNTQNQKLFPCLDEVTVQLFIDHAAAKLKTAPPVVKAELKGMVPSGPPLGELAKVHRTKIVLIFNLHFPHKSKKMVHRTCTIHHNMHADEGVVSM